LVIGRIEKEAIHLLRTSKVNFYLLGGKSWYQILFLDAFKPAQPINEPCRNSQQSHIFIIFHLFSIEDEVDEPFDTNKLYSCYLW
jgi:hypothetical protein